MKAIPFIQIVEKDGRKQYLINEEARKIVQRVEGKFGVVAVAGPWRTGKSFLINQLMGKRSNAGFEVGNTVNACTKGIWIHPEPKEIGNGMKVFFTDTEGLGSTGKSQEEDCTIFSLALLMSSLFIWNSRGVIDGSALDDFGLVVQLTNRIHSRSLRNKDTTSVEDFSDYLPDFYWILRDFILSLEDEKGNPLSDNQYLEKALLPKELAKKGGNSKDEVRSLLRRCFKSRGCITLPRPVGDEASLRELENLSPSTFRSSFTSKMEECRNHLLSTLKPKCFNTELLSTESYCNLIDYYLECINTSNIINLNTINQRFQYDKMSRLTKDLFLQCDSREYGLKEFYSHILTSFEEKVQKNLVLYKEFGLFLDCYHHYHSQNQLSTSSIEDEKVGEDLFEDVDVSNVENKISTSLRDSHIACRTLFFSKYSSRNIFQMLPRLYRLSTRRKHQKLQEKEQQLQKLRNDIIALQSKKNLIQQLHQQELNSKERMKAIENQQNQIKLETLKKSAQFTKNYYTLTTNNLDKIKDGYYKQQNSKLLTNCIVALQDIHSSCRDQKDILLPWKVKSSKSKQERSSNDTVQQQKESLKKEIQKTRQDLKRSASSITEQEYTLAVSKASVLTAMDEYSEMGAELQNYAKIILSLRMVAYQKRKTKTINTLINTHYPTTVLNELEKELTQEQWELLNNPYHF